MPRTVFGGLGVLVVAAALGGCAPAAPPAPPLPPTVMATPTIVWETSSNSPLESDPWVIAARAASLGYTLANNTGDFSIEQFASTHVAEAANKIFDSWLFAQDSSEKPDRDPGPEIFVPQSVVVADNGLFATVEGCIGHWAREWWASPGPATYTLEGHGRGYNLIRVGDSYLQDSSTGSTIECDASSAAVGRFDPQPDGATEVDSSNIRGPVADSQPVGDEYSLSVEWLSSNIPALEQYSTDVAHVLDTGELDYAIEQFQDELRGSDDYDLEQAASDIMNQMRRLYTDLGALGREAQTESPNADPGLIASIDTLHDELWVAGPIHETLPRADGVTPVMAFVTALQAVRDSHSANTPG